MQYGHVAKVLRTTLCPHHLTLSCEDSSAGQRNTYCIFCKAWFQTFRSNVQVCTAISQNTSSMHSNASKKQMDLVGILRSLHYDPSTLLEYTNLARMAPTIHSIFTSPDNNYTATLCCNSQTTPPLDSFRPCPCSTEPWLHARSSIQRLWCIQ